MVAGGDGRGQRPETASIRSTAAGSPGGTRGSSEFHTAASGLQTSETLGAGIAPLDLAGLNRYDETVGSPAPPFDPLRLCVFTTVALIACLLGPIAVLGFALIAIAGYTRARRQGLLRSKCKLGDTRLVLAYLSVLAVLAAVATPFWVMFWIGRF
ncbi:hypothetical protein MICRO8M_10061 [Microbacterium sp. 8M]|uniref:hypothetical protein n=1 Tax=Microbacterium sp. 8M TaxID=2653153 RepID=UPI0012F215F2|nr:hypothetical protein [Microbacterium sp. 8M]VXA92582.1 hypothetical protein MICRO8M_10061 [Microbacterium sp. 8M]